MMPFNADQFAHPFAIPFGCEGEQRLHAWLDRLHDEGRIGPWFSDSISTDHRGTVALIEFERDGDAATAKSMWGREKLSAELKA